MSAASKMSDFIEACTERTGWRDSGREKGERENQSSEGEDSEEFSGSERQHSRGSSRSRPSHIPVWSATVLNEPVFLASGKGKEEFLARLVVDVVPSLGTVRHSAAHRSWCSFIPNSAPCVLSLPSSALMNSTAFSVSTVSCVACRCDTLPCMLL
jgi:hypothetical protein